MKVEYPITFFYYKDLQTVLPFYRDILQFELAVDQGWCKILRVSPTAYIGLVNEAKGSLKATADKPVLFTLVVDDVDAWYAYLQTKDVCLLGEPVLHTDIGVYAFFLQDPSGYRLEIQQFIQEPTSG